MFAKRLTVAGIAQLAASWAFASLALAHPHQFVDVTAELAVDAEGRLSAVRAVFAMDETESLYIASEFGLDPEGPLTQAQSETVFRGYAEGYEQFNWFTHVRRGEATAQLVRPTKGAATMRNGVLSIEWELPLARPLSLTTAPIVLQFYDPTFYADTTLKAAPRLVGDGAKQCDLELIRFVPDEASQALQDTLALLPPDATPEEKDVGRRFADRVEARCGDGSGQG